MITKHKVKEMFQLTKIVLAVIVCGALAGCSTRSGPPADVQYDIGASPYHTVKKGDSIASIARKYGMDKRELVRINGLASPYRIVRGQRLLVRAHKSDGAEAADEMEMPATEQVESVPEEDGIDVKPLAPIAGVAGSATAVAAAAAGAEYSNPPPPPQQSIPASAGSFIWPTKGNVIRDFSLPGKGKTQNDGINIAAPEGTPVVAANNGVVAHAGNQLRGFGNVVLVKHDNGMMTVYAHLNKVSVRKGEMVRAGQKLGTVGQTGTVKSPQLHFEIRRGRKPIDPNQYLG